MPISRIHAVAITIAALIAILAPAYADAALPTGGTGGASIVLSQANNRTLPKASADAGYVNPFSGDWYSAGRTDMGVDFCLRPGAPIRAVGNGVVVGISSGWFDGQPYVWYRLLSGPYTGRYVYVAEQISDLTRVGARIRAGQPLAHYGRSGTCIEMGWSAANGATLAQATTGYYEGQVTPAGVSFAHFLSSLGVAGLSRG